MFALNRRLKVFLVRFLFLVPALVLYTTFFTIPFLEGVALSFTRWDGVTSPRFVGLRNYVWLLTKDITFWDSLRKTLVVVAVNFGLTCVLAMFLALLLSEKGFMRGVGRMVVFLPNVISMVHVGFIWKFLLTRVFGLGLLSDAGKVLPAVALTLGWQTIGYVMVINMAALSSVERDLVEAAMIDGASRWVAFFKVKLPLMMPTVRVGVFMNIVWAFKVFDVVFSLTGGGPGLASEVLVLNIYKEAFVFNNFGYASAKSVILSAIVVFITVLQLKLTRSSVDVS